MKKLSILLLILLAAVLQGCMESKQEAEERFESAYKFERQGEYDKAAKEYEAAIKNWKTYTEAHRRYQDIEIARGNYDALVKKYEKYVNDNPKSPCFNYLMGRLAPDSEKRIAYYRKALTYDPNYLWAIDGIGSEYLKQGKQQEAIKQLKKVIEIDSEFPQVHLSLARAWYSMGNLNPALSEIKKYNDLSPNSYVGLELMGQIYLKKRQTDKAAEAWIEANKADPYRTLPLIRLAELYLNEKKYDETYEILKKAYALDPSHLGAKLIEAELALAMNDTAKAAKLADVALAKEENNRDALMIKALVLAGKGDKVKAENLLKQILSIYPDDLGALEQLGIMNYNKRNFADAEKFLSKAALNSSMSLNAKRVLRNSLMLLDKIAAAEPLAERLAMEPERIEKDSLALLEIYAYLNDVKSFRETFLKFYDDGNITKATVFKAYCSIGKGDPKPFSAEFADVSVRLKRPEERRFISSISDILSGEYKKISARYKDAAGLDEYDSLIFSYALFKAGEVKKARDILSSHKIRKETKEFASLWSIMFTPSGNAKILGAQIKSLEAIRSKSFDFAVVSVSLREIENKKVQSQKMPRNGKNLKPKEKKGNKE